MMSDPMPDTTVTMTDAGMGGEMMTGVDATVTMWVLWKGW